MTTPTTALQPGMRVRVVGLPVGNWEGGLKLQGDLGTLVELDEQEDGDDTVYWVVHMDRPALLDAEGYGMWYRVRRLLGIPRQADEAEEIVWEEDKLEPLPTSSTIPS